MADVSFALLVGVRLVSEVFANLLVVGIVFGATGSLAYTVAILAVAGVTLGYSMLGGLHASLRTDVLQFSVLTALLDLRQHRQARGDRHEPHAAHLCNRHRPPGGSQIPQPNRPPATQPMENTMLRNILLPILATFLFIPSLQAQPEVEGLVILSSPHSATETLDRLETALDKRDIANMRWSHHTKAAEVDIALRPTELMLFGNPALGSHFFTSRQSAGIDLPLKALAWEDADGQVWFAYNDPSWIADRHGIDDRSEVRERMTGVLQMLSKLATGEGSLD